ncbi:MAG: CHASE3 domain-containing protein [Candidatus Omnitrophica bacterium]|nr:CHASE3 domain-containing protein [Candidatus Omnitrophota bacterium]
MKNGLIQSSPAERIRPSTIAQQLLLLLILPLAFQILFMVALIRAQHHSEQAQRLSARAEAFTANAYGLLDLLLKADANLRTGLLEQDPGALTSYRNAAEQIPFALERLRQTITESPRHAAVFGRLEKRINEKFSFMDDIAVNASSATANAVALTDLLERNNASTATIQEAVSAFVEKSLQITDTRQQAMKRSLRQLHRLIWTTLIVLIGLTYLIWIFIRSGIAKRLSLLIENTKRLTSGEPLVRPTGGQDEFARLEQAFHKMADALAASMSKERLAKEAAESANRAKNEFLANMSHELHTPLNAVIGYSELMRDGTVGPLSPTQQEYTQYVCDGGRHLLSLVNDILDLSKIEAGKMELHLETVDIKTLLQNSLAMIKGRALTHELEISLRIAEDTGSIRADERKVKQMVFNLLSNAAKFTPDGGTIGVEALRQDKQVIVTVWDTGIGIDPKDADKVFQEFRQIDSAYSRKNTGTGLGLSLTRRFAKLHGGSIWFESSGKNQGARFSFALPVSGPENSTKKDKT